MNRGGSVFGALRSSLQSKSLTRSSSSTGVDAISELLSSTAEAALLSFARAQVTSFSTQQNAAGVWQITAADTPRAMGSNLLIEGQRTNMFRNPRFEGATPGVIGAGGVAPTFMPLTPPANTQIEIISVSTVQGLPCLEIVLSTSTAVSSSFALETTGAFTYTPGAPYTLSLYAQRTGGSLTGFTTLGPRVRVDTPTASNGGIASLLGMSSTELSRHVASTYTAISDAQSGRVQMAFTTTGAASVRFRIAGLQVEQASTATTPILPAVGSPAASTRGADFWQMPTASRLGAGGIGSVFWKGTPTFDPLVVNTLLQADDGTNISWAVLQEPERTNYFANPRGEGATTGLLGSGGSWPTGWGGGSVFSGLSMEIIGQGVSNGMPYTRFRLFGTLDGGASRTTSLYSAPATQGQTVTNAVFSRLISGSTIGLNIQVEVREYAGGSPGTVSGASIPLTAAWARTSVSRTMADPATTSARYTTRISGATGFAYDVVFDLASPTIEAASYTTTPLFPPAGSPATSSRAANTLTLTNGLAAANLGTITPGAETSVAISFDPSRLAGSLNRGAVVVVGPTTATPTTLRVQTGIGGINHTPGEVKPPFLITPAILPDAQLQAL